MQNSRRTSAQRLLSYTTLGLLTLSAGLWGGGAPVWAVPDPDSSLQSDQLRVSSKGATSPSECVEHAASTKTVPSDAPCEQRFSDVTPDSKFYHHIQWLAGAKIAAGMPDGTYAPGKPVTRGAMGAFLHRFDTEVKPPLPDYAPFTDVQSSHTFFKPVSWLRDTGLGAGYADGSFKPGRPVTRGAMATFLYRAAGSPHYVPPAHATFSDVPTGSTFFKTVEWLNSTSITSGLGDDRFGPGHPVTRATMAAFLWRFERAYHPGAAKVTVGEAATGFASVSASTSSVTLAWPETPGANGYTLRWSRSDGLDLPEIAKLDASARVVNVDGLRPGVTYHFSLTPNGATSLESRVTASTTELQAVTVASFNVAASKPASSSWVSWGKRRDAVWATVNSRQPDVIALQEASFAPVQANGEPDTGHPVGVNTRFYGDVVKGFTSASGTAYKLTNELPWNCKDNPWSPGNGTGQGRCEYYDQGASLDLRIAYNPDTVTMNQQGSRIVFGNTPKNGDPFNADERYLSWAVFTQNATAQQFFAATTHLHPNDVSKRVAQATKVRTTIEELNTNKLPVIFMGDLNTDQWAAHGTHFERVIEPFLTDGYVNVSGSQKSSYRRHATGLGTAYSGRSNCNSFNGFHTQYVLSSSEQSGPKCWHHAFTQTQYTGTNIDYILTKGVHRVPVFESVLAITNSGKVRGTLPSDHLMLTAKILL